MFVHKRFNFSASVYIAVRLGNRLVRDTQIPNRASVERDGSALHRGIRKHRQKDLPAGRLKHGTTYSKILALQDHVCVTIAESDIDNFQITAKPNVSTIV